MSGDQASVIIGDEAGVVARYVTVLAELPQDPAWVLVGGFAVNARLGLLHRITGDVDALSSSEERFIELLCKRPDVIKKAAGKLEVGDPSVRVDIMALEGNVHGTDVATRTFALARHFGYETAHNLTVTVVDRSDGTHQARCAVSVATIEALVMLKVVALRGRQGRKSKVKVGSDIHDLVRLVRGRYLDEIAQTMMGAPRELVTYVGAELVKWFHPDEDGRLSLVRLRTLAGQNPDALAIMIDELALLSELGQAVQNLAG